MKVLVETGTSFDFCSSLTCKEAIDVISIYLDFLSVVFEFARSGAYVIPGDYIHTLARWLIELAQEPDFDLELFQNINNLMNDILVLDYPISKPLELVQILFQVHDQLINTSKWDEVGADISKLFCFISAQGFELILDNVYIRCCHGIIFQY